MPPKGEARQGVWVAAAQYSSAAGSNTRYMLQSVYAVGVSLQTVGRGAAFACSVCVGWGWGVGCGGQGLLARICAGHDIAVAGVAHDCELDLSAPTIPVSLWMGSSQTLS